MSKAIALIKFTRTGNIYYGCYNGTSDVMIPYLCTPEECFFNEDEHCQGPISYCKHLGDIGNWELPDNVFDLDQVEIYSNYGRGFYWSSEGSESAKMIKENLMPWDNCPEDIKYGVPQWVKDFAQRVLEVKL